MKKNDSRTASRDERVAAFQLDHDLYGKGLWFGVCSLHYGHALYDDITHH
jgi:hypothetical protein